MAAIHNMCVTKQEIKDLIDQEVPQIVNRELGLFVRKKMWYIVVTLFVMGSVWGVLAFQVNQNTDARSQGDRFTAQDGEVLQAHIDSIADRQDSLEAWLIRVETKLDVVLQK